MEEFTQDWEVYQVLTSEFHLATYMDLDTRCNVEDLMNMVEIVETRSELDDIARIKREREAAQNS